MKPFHYHENSMYAAAAAILLGKTVTEDVDTINEAADTTAIEKIVATLKVGNTTNFGVVKAIGTDSITFKAKDTPLTRMKFSQYKMGSRDLALEKLVKIKEEAELEEEVDYYKFKQLAILGLLSPGDANKAMLGMKAIEAGKPATQEQKAIIGDTLVLLVNMITGDSAVLNKLKKSARDLSSKGKLEETLKELYSIKTSAVRTLMAEFTSLDAVELEDFFKAAQAYFAKEAYEFDNDDFNDLSIIMDKAAKIWHNRAAN